MKPLDNPEYILEADPKVLTQKRNSFQKNLKLDEHSNVQQEMKVIKSEASIVLDDIKGIIFGGSSARFWLSRKHMISDL